MSSLKSVCLHSSPFFLQFVGEPQLPLWSLYFLCDLSTLSPKPVDVNSRSRYTSTRPTFDPRPDSSQPSSYVTYPSHVLGSTSHVLSHFQSMVRYIRRKSCPWSRKLDPLLLDPLLDVLSVHRLIQKNQQDNLGTDLDRHRSQRSRHFNYIIIGGTILLIYSISFGSMDSLNV